MNNFEENNYEYLAGALDCGGAINALVEQKRVTIEVALYSNCTDLIQLIKKVFKFGKIYKRKWSIKTNSGSKVVLDALRPFLVVKKKQCEIALNLIEETDLEKRKQIAIEISEANLASKEIFSNNS